MSLIKMIPGSFFVLGVFFVDDSDIYKNKEKTDKIMAILSDISQLFRRNKYLYGTSTTMGSTKLIMFYNSATKSLDCKYYDPKDKNTLIPAECIFLDKLTEWIFFETNYELDEIFPIAESNEKLNIETHFTATLEAINLYVNNSKIFVQDEPVEDGIILENYLKKCQNKYDKTKGISASIFLTTTALDEKVLIEQFDGIIRYSGIIASRVWAHPKSSFKEIYDFIRIDIMRSMCSRIQVYCDGLIDPNASNDAVVINEPPRRVFFNKVDDNGIQFCDYIFRGESPSVVTSQAKFILDLEIETQNVNDAVEGYPDDDSFGISKIPNTSNRQSKYAKGYGQVMYIGIASAVIVLIISILLHFIFR
ncbi:protein odr-4 homolog [Condylostylus longicornis]|uniref:protein odr-4 homolog n=1 Tax=Condylostylus longicornis TaxID=2530218 RepID=UPI00244DBCAC|nr:protein odr-4 homolog [Condylostylus longicornis]